MSLKPCKECGKEVSRSAKRCPHCGKKYPTGGLTVPAKLFLLIVGVIAFVNVWGSAGKSSATATPATTTRAPHPAKTTHVARQQATPSYRVVKTDDDSYGSVRRLNVRVRLPSHYSHSQVLRVAKAVVAGVVKKQPVNAVSVMFYGPHTATDGAWDVARVDWAPHGNWSEAGDVPTGHYGSFLYRVDYRAPQPAETASSSLQPSGQAGLLGTPLPDGAVLTRSRSADPENGVDPAEWYRVPGVSAADLASFFSREMISHGWSKNGTSTAVGGGYALIFDKGSLEIGVLINSSGGTFSLMGS